MRIGCAVGVCLKTKLCILYSRRFGNYSVNKNFKIFRAEKCRGSSSEVNFFYPWLIAKYLQVQFPFFQQRSNICFFNGMVYRDACVASAIRAQAFAIRKM